jgi:hypothetical protein
VGSGKRLVVDLDLEKFFDWGGEGTHSADTTTLVMYILAPDRQGRGRWSRFMRFLYMCLRLKVDERRSAVDRPWIRVHLEYTVIGHR